MMSLEDLRAAARVAEEALKLMVPTNVGVVLLLVDRGRADEKNAPFATSARGLDKAQVARLMVSWLAAQPGVTVMPVRIEVEAPEAKA